MTDYTAKEALVILLEDYRERQKMFSSLNDFDKIMEKERNAFKQHLPSLEEPLNKIATQLFESAEQFFFLFKVVESKIDYIVDAIRHALDTKNPISFANNARSLVEHIATFSNVAFELLSLAESLEGQQSEEKISRIFKKAKNVLSRAYYGKGCKGPGTKETKAIHINDSLEILSKEVSNIKEIYNRLCEFVHPNFGSNLLVSSGSMCSGRLKPPEEFHRETLDELRRISSYCMIYLEKNATSLYSPLVTLRMYLEFCYIPGAKLPQIFSKRKVSFTGDGKTKETAIFFPRAKNACEAIRMSYEFFEREGYKSLGITEIGSVEPDYIFDIHHTNKGLVWVKIPVWKH